MCQTRDAHHRYAPVEFAERCPSAGADLAHGGLACAAPQEPWPWSRSRPRLRRAGGPRASARRAPSVLQALLRVPEAARRASTSCTARAQRPSARLPSARGLTTRRPPHAPLEQRRLRVPGARERIVAARLDVDAFVPRPVGRRRRTPRAWPRELAAEEGRRGFRTSGCRRTSPTRLVHWA